MEADAIVLVQVTSLETTAEGWTATATLLGNLEGTYPGNQVAFSNPRVVTCYQLSEPRIGRHYVLYFQKTAQGFQYINGFRFGFARASGDPRLEELDRLMPWGAVRSPTADELRLIEIAQPRFDRELEGIELSGLSRLYSRRGASSLTMLLLPGPITQPLMLNDYEERPSDRSCGCAIVEVTAHLDDLQAAGALPQSDP